MATLIVEKREITFVVELTESEYKLLERASRICRETLKEKGGYTNGTLEDLHRLETFFGLRTTAVT